MKKAIKRLYIQYHNFGKLEYYPGDQFDEIERGTPALKSWHYVSTNKAQALRLEPDSDGIILLMGIKIGNRMSYFAWSFTIFKACEVFCDEDLRYNIHGKQKLFQAPVRLNSMDGFESFRHRQGNFGLGFQNITTDPWAKQLQTLIEQGPYVTDSRISWGDWVRQFEITNGIRGKLRVHPHGNVPAI